MEDRFLFRAWDKEQKYMNSCKGIYYNDIFEQPDIFVPMQCTGFKDAGENLIFEGDICRCGDRLAVVEWDSDIAMFRIIIENELYTFDNFFGYELEVIGNIWENPELLEV